MSLIEGLRVGIGSSGVEERQAALSEFCDEAVHVLNGGLDLPDIHPSGRVLKGNVSGRLVKATFETTGAEVFIPHDVGYTCDRWVQVAPEQPAIFSKGTTENSASGVYVIATALELNGVMQTTFPFNSHFYVWGRRPDIRVRRIVS